MLTDVVTFIALIIAEIICISLIIIIKNTIRKSQLRTAFLFLNLMMLISCTGVILQDLLSKPLNIEPIYFEYLTYIGNVFLSVGFLLVGVIYANTKIEFKKRYLLILVIPILSLLILWTNDYHHLFYKEYSIYTSEAKTGEYAIVYNIYTILLFLIGIVYLLTYSIKNSKIFSKQAILIIISVLIPILVNILSTLKVIDATVYITPISFTISIFILFFAIFKFKLLRTTPIALRKIVDRISDSYLVLNEDNIITDFNETFIRTFKQKDKDLRSDNIIKYLEKHKIETENFKQALEKVKNSDETVIFEQKIEQIEKIFSIEINRISQNETFLGILVLFKDITQHKKDVEIIQSNQSMLIEKERLASLGQMIGGIAHNLKTPIMSIAGAAEGITELVKEYDLSIDNPQVNSEDHHQIAKEMNEWIEKIRTYTEYMSDVITAVKGQAVNFSEEEVQYFTIGELVKHVTILMKHELKNALVYLNTNVKCNEDITIKGNINSLVQVINNMISNAIQAYNGEPEKQIDMVIEYVNKNVTISIKDYGPGLPEKVQEKLFKEMITTKGKNGTGLGLYMSYSNIKAHFGGDITVETQKNKGTEFKIKLPV